jgi:hypothetical protein
MLHFRPAKILALTATSWHATLILCAALVLLGACEQTKDPQPFPDPDRPADMAPDQAPADMTPDLSPDMAEDMAPDQAPEAFIDPAGGVFSDRFALPGFLGQSAARVLTLLQDDQGRLLAGGIFTHVGADPVRGIAARGLDGEWSALAGGLPYYVEGIVQLADGRIVAGGWSEDNGELDGRLSVLEGGQWREVGEFDGRIFHLALTPEGEVLIGGEFTKIGAVDAAALARWDGTRFEAVSAGLFEAGALVHNTTIWEGKLCAVGFFGRAAGQDAGGVVCELPGGWAPLGALPGEVFDVASLVDGTLIAVGSFVMEVDAATDTFSAGIARWDGAKWVAFEGRGVDGGLINQVRDIEPEGAGFVIAGQFSVVGVYIQQGGPEAVPASHVARWTGSRWGAMGAGVQPTIGPYAVNVEGGYALLNAAGKLWMGGLFHRVEGKLGTGLASWDGAGWTPAVEEMTLQGIEGEVWAVARRASGAVYLSGNLGTTPDTPSIMVYEGGQLKPMPDAPRGAVRALWVDGQDRLVAAGRFSAGQREALVARWDGAAWTALVEAAGDGEVRRVIPQGDGLIIAGEFDLGGGKRGVARIGADGAVSALGEGVAGSVQHVVIDPEGRVVVAGSLGADGLAVGPLAFDGAAWAPVGGGLGGFVYGLVNFRGKLIAAGSYLKPYVAPDGGRPDAPGVEWPMAAWNGAAWEEFGELRQPDFAAAAYFAQVFGGVLYVGGGFTTASGVPTRNLAYTKDGVTFGEVGGGVDDLTNAVGGDDEALWFCGPYREAGGQPSFGVARLVLGRP